MWLRNLRKKGFCNFAEMYQLLQPLAERMGFKLGLISMLLYSVQLIVLLCCSKLRAEYRVHQMLCVQSGIKAVPGEQPGHFTVHGVTLNDNKPADFVEIRLAAESEERAQEWIRCWQLGGWAAMLTRCVFQSNQLSTVTPRQEGGRNAST